jgi:hypothetical protein
MTQMPMTQDLETFIGNFAEEDWERVLKSLAFFISHEERVLCNNNCGDREWEELAQFQTLKRDIELYVIGIRT